MQQYCPRLEDDGGESGEYYIVNTRQGRTIVRRPNPPPTSPPLDDDFDAITQGGCTTTYRPGPASEWAARVRDSAVPTTTPPLDDDFDAITYTATAACASLSRRSSAGPGARKGALNGTRHNERRRHEENRRWGGDFGDEWEDHCRSGQVPSPYPDNAYDPQQDVERKRSSGGLRSKPGPYANVDRWKKTVQESLLAESSNTTTGNRRKESSDVLRRLVSTRKQQQQHLSPQARPPQTKRRGLEYEMIDRRVVEDGPERTVTIATWREEVARKSRPDVEMSIFYVNPDDYAVEELDTGIAMISAGSHGGLTKFHSSEKKRASSKQSRRQQDVGDRSLVLRKDTDSRATTGHGWSSLAETRRTSSDPVHSTRTKVSTQTVGHRSASPFISGSFPGGGSGSSSKKQLFSSIMINQPSSRMQRSTTTSQIPSSSNHRPSSSSRNRYQRMSETTGTPQVQQPEHPPRTSSPFHATRSGSTISSIKRPLHCPSHSMSFILSSCQPSLTHIAPILGELGIVSEEHLDALVRMKEGTRNREVKEEALRKGMTVVEWAILWDKLLELQG